MSMQLIRTVKPIGQRCEKKLPAKIEMLRQNVTIISDILVMSGFLGPELDWGPPISALCSRYYQTNT